MSSVTLVPRRLGSGSPEFFSAAGRSVERWVYIMWNEQNNRKFSRSSFIKCYYNFMLIQDDIQCSPIVSMGALQWPIYFGA
jgi:hypothetical protein